MPPTNLLVMSGALLVGLAILGAGLFVASIGVGRVRLARRLRRAGPTPLSEVADATGLVAFNGVARAGAEGTLEAPISETDCLAYAVQSRSRNRDDADVDTNADEIWSQDGRASAGVPFEVVDGGDRVAVDPRNAVLSLADWEPDATAWTDRADLPFDARDRLAAVGLPSADAEPTDDPSASSDAVTQCRELRLEPGTDVHVFGGSVVDDARDRTDDALVTVGGDDWFEVSAGERSTVIPDRQRSGSLYVIFGGLLAIPGLGFTLAGLVGLASTFLL
ncbi:hypothetical protein Htur_1100 [Haloterrigena turkmenica DSM 5511]|uniref:RING-type E3 ubiquitin transferase n=1 Tax=Haloterrigena turkmenica (strain ATCC 51198 / DSM 5511 / JCM 9101 / NCIMB 13204 / VKM B-1734 / 4k) TaxID=543526 RepID=D2RZ68_HALTV|nr:hypothetical protein [Haloterrigena turkmenica]ADB59992.1 hypothetical protein Htur_1100 [Haloterrigena turkmenica DSM 5511]